ncbi:protein L [Stenotrophomonas maltophilia]|jgi:hypothetical protein|uniref:Protein L n=2 Tax=Stenotrophomonas TaxID=40323 RepID=A0A246KQS3_9GAMM|nr:MULTISPECIES: hypothetical protein [Stenotrophomonas]TGR45063.1 protein L [bacterium M00.F.Ca.ET.199.01.1.1]TGT03839.1 protein L [bacterium M00.F.Ca.ET.177.01.1.1]TGT58358.1 protein L [Mesorhizobium sp. M00.F.Ca.ET.170.01.1.1]TGU08286.1 protein L [bacterium M00.F.Ca.ET.163.01.1.1]TGU92340.1 protein L [Mesorhizobium sp. M00.F.Ca.ET.151.01.1.1]TGV54374.1 protein L [bacterium M00.F.Ca.ET.141.01.1.1]
MAWHTSESVLGLGTATNRWWNTIYGPADKVEVSGIYRCLGCKREVTCNRNDPFPPQPKHVHTPQQGPIRWKLNVRTNTEGT